ncbi:MAG: HK97 gp10 family phage protein [Sulfurimonas sp.]
MIGSDRQVTQIEGLDALLKVLQQLPPNVSGKLVKPAMREAGDMLAGELHRNAYKQRVAAEGRGYKDRDNIQLNKTAGTRAKVYRKGSGFYVAVGFDYSKGGSHGHLVEFGHRIVRGGTLAGEGRTPGITAAGIRFMRSKGFIKGTYESGKVLHGKRKGKPRMVSGFAKGGNVYKSSDIGMTVMGRQVRGGGRVVMKAGAGLLSGGMRTKPCPMLGPAWETMKRPMMIAIENELRKIERTAVRLAGNVRGGVTGFGENSAGPMYW